MVDCAQGARRDSIHWRPVVDLVSFSILKKNDAEWCARCGGTAVVDDESVRYCDFPEVVSPPSAFIWSLVDPLGSWCRRPVCWRWLERRADVAARARERIEWAWIKWSLNISCECMLWVYAGAKWRHTDVPRLTTRPTNAQSWIRPQLFLALHGANVFQIGSNGFCKPNHSV